MDTDHLEEVLAASPSAKMLYTVPDFQNPTGVTMSLARRRRLIELANGARLLVVEDTPVPRRCATRASIPPDAEEPRHRGPGRAPRELLQDPRARGAARLGGGEPPRSSSKLTLLKLAADTQNSTLNMAATSAYLARFDIDAHIAEALPVYRHKRDLMLDTMRDHFPDTVSCTRPQGGLFTWLTFPDGFDAAAFMREQLLPEAEGRLRAGCDLLPRPPAAQPRPGQLLRRPRRPAGPRHQRHRRPSPPRPRLTYRTSRHTSSPRPRRRRSVTCGFMAKIAMQKRTCMLTCPKQRHMAP